MNSNMNFPAPLAVMGLLAGVAGLAISAFGTVTSLMLKKPRWTRWIGILAGAMTILYFGLLFGFSLASHETTLAGGEEKYFCELDCHLAYSVVSSKEVVESGARVVAVTLRTRFDEKTISARRPGEAPLYPSPRQVVLVDDQKRQFSPRSTSGTPLSHPLIPGEAYQTNLKFLVPADSKNLRLLITTPEWDYRFIVGDENSFGHQKTFLAIPTAASVPTAEATPKFSSAFLHD